MASATASRKPPTSWGVLTVITGEVYLSPYSRSPREESPGKPVGSVHGDSIGVHASDSANAWRNLARVGNQRHRHACLILGACQAAFDRTSRGGDFQRWTALPVPRHLDEIRGLDPATLGGALDEAIRGNLQARAAAIVHRCGELDQPARPVFDQLLRHAVSEDGSLHGEKFYRTVAEEFAATRPAFRWRLLVALARVTVSEYGRPAPGVDEARRLLGVA